MAVGLALSMEDSREDMGLSKGAMGATATGAFRPMALSKAAAATPTTPGAILAKALLTAGRRLVAVSMKACKGCLLM